MLAYRILATVFLGISIIFGAVLKTLGAGNNDVGISGNMFVIIWGILWRVFVIVTVWVI